MQQWKSNYYILRVYVCSLRYSACMRHIVICGLPGSTIFFPHYLIHRTIFGGGLLKIKCAFFSITFV